MAYTLFHRYGGGPGGLPATLNPLSYPGLEEYYDSRLGLSSVPHGGSVAPWPDQSGNARDMLGTGMPSVPTYLLTSSLSPKGKPLVRWNGTDNCLATGTINPAPVFTQGYTFYCYGSFGATAAPPAPFAGGIIWQTDLGQPQLIRQTVTTNQTAWRDTTGFHNIVSQSTTLGIHQLAYVFEPPSGTGLGKLYMDGVLLGSAVWTFTYNASIATLLGNTPAFNVPLMCDMGHFLWYSRAHDQATITRFAGWAGAIWGY